MNWNILAVGRNTEILDTVVRLLNNNAGWQATGTPCAIDALERMSQQRYDLVLLGGGLEVQEEDGIRTAASFLVPSVPVVQHYGGGSGLLVGEVRAALEQGQVLL